MRDIFVRRGNKGHKGGARPCDRQHCAKENAALLVGHGDSGFPAAAWPNKNEFFRTTFADQVTSHQQTKGTATRPERRVSRRERQARRWVYCFLSPFSTSSFLFLVAFLCVFWPSFKRMGNCLNAAGRPRGDPPSQRVRLSRRSKGSQGFLKKIPFWVSHMKTKRTGRHSGRGRSEHQRFREHHQCGAHCPGSRSLRGTPRPSRGLLHRHRLGGRGFFLVALSAAQCLDLQFGQWRDHLWPGRERSPGKPPAVCRRRRHCSKLLSVLSVGFFLTCRSWIDVRL